METFNDIKTKPYIRDDYHSPENRLAGIRGFKDEIKPHRRVAGIRGYSETPPKTLASTTELLELRKPLLHSPQSHLKATQAYQDILRIA